MKNLLQSLLIIALLSSGYVIENTNAQTVGQKGPEFSLNTLSNDEFTLSDHRGKVVFIFLFGNTCPHCISNGPNTQSGIYEVFKADTNFVCIGIDVWNGTNNQVQSFKDRTGISYEMCVKGSSVASAYGTTYDRMLVIDQDGILRYKSTANAGSNIVKQAKEVIEGLLQGSSGIENPGLSQISWSIYPNPAKGFATIQTQFKGNASVYITMVDMTGRTVYQEYMETDPSGQLRLSVSEYPTGMYYIRAKSENQRTGSRLVISR